ncbi:MAG: hypothetical protein QNK04_10600 [Myxococcota bacterium]|nr:hypothetical protein [Myxococcota bacterium]
MPEDKGTLKQIGDELKQLRDEIELKLHLASADARDEFEALEKKLEHYRARLDVVGKATEEAAEDVGDALSMLGDEIRKGYHKIRALL